MVSSDGVNQLIEAFFEKSAVPQILYQALLESIDDPFAIIDRDYRLLAVKMDSSWEGGAKYIGQRCYELVLSMHDHCPDCPVAALFEEGELTKARRIVSLADESKVWYEVRAYPVFDKGYNVTSAITIGHNLRNKQITSTIHHNRIDKLQRTLDCILESQLRRSLDGKACQPGPNLTYREDQILTLMAEGLTNSEISDILSISPNTVKTYTIRIFNKLGVNNRTQATALVNRWK